MAASHQELPRFGGIDSNDTDTNVGKKRREAPQCRISTSSISLSKVPAIVQHLLNQLAAEYETLCIENAALLEELQASVPNSSNIGEPLRTSESKCSRDSKGYTEDQRFVVSSKSVPQSLTHRAQPKAIRGTSIHSTRSSHTAPTSVEEDADMNTNSSLPFSVHSESLHHLFSPPWPSSPSGTSSVSPAVLPKDLTSARDTLKQDGHCAPQPSTSLGWKEKTQEAERTSARLFVPLRSSKSDSSLRTSNHTAKNHLSLSFAESAQMVEFSSKKHRMTSSTKSTASNWVIKSPLSIRRTLSEITLLASTPLRSMGSGMLSWSGFKCFCWDVLYCTCFLIDFWTILFRLIFLKNVESSLGFALLHWTATGVFVLDILLNLFISHFPGHWHSMEDRRLFATNYEKFWLWFDIIVTVPWGLMLPPQTSIISLLRMVKLPVIWKSFSSQYALLMALRREAPFFVAIPVTLLVLVIMAHTHGCLYEVVAKTHSTYCDPHDFDDALRRYHTCFWWAYTAFVSGSRSAEIPRHRNLEILIASERIVFLALACYWGIFKLLVLCESDVRAAAMVHSALDYMREHRISLPTHVEVASAVQELTKLDCARSHFLTLMGALPVQWRQMIEKEMWEQLLLSFQLIARMDAWHQGFMQRLLSLVHEDIFPPRSIVCHEGEAYQNVSKIMSGTVSIRSSQNSPELSEGMWIGENALINPFFECRRTLHAIQLMVLMSVPVSDFHFLVEQLGMRDRLKDECAEHLWRGLCGRCGAFGSHFAHECPTLDKRFKVRAPKPKRGGTINFSNLRSNFGFRQSDNAVSYEAEFTIQKDLKEFLSSTSRLEAVLPVLQKANIRSFHDLEHAMRDEGLRAELDLISDDGGQGVNINSDSVHSFREQCTARIRAKLDGHARRKCLVFLSHYKVEAGTEAALIRSELQLLIERDKSQLARNFEVPVFLDSENLNDLTALQQHVIDSHNLVLMLTKGVLLRPWVLVEVLTAKRNGVPVIPLNIVKPEAEFEFPTEDFYTKLLAGEFLDKAAMRVLHDCDIQLSELEQALRGIFNRIAVRYSPHRSANIRQAELEGLLHEVTLERSHLTPPMTNVPT